MNRISLRRSAFSAGRWTTASLLIRAGLQFSQTMVLARILAPADFGLMAIVSSFYMIVYLFVDLGLSNSLIHFPTPTLPVLSTLYWFNLAAATLSMLVLAISAWPLSVLYHQPALFHAMALLSLAMPLGALGQQFRVMAEKELRFSVLAPIEMSAAACGFLTAVILAILGSGIYSLIFAILISAAISSALSAVFLSEGLRPNLSLQLRDAFPYLRYGSYRMGETFFNSMQAQADVLIGGTIAGAASIGQYAVPRDLMLRIANTIVNPAVTRVGLPLMAKVQSDKAALRSVYLQTLRMTASINFPIYAIVAVWADQFVFIFLGPQWLQAASYMRLFAIWGLIRSTGNPIGSLLYATGQVKRAFWWNLAHLAVVPALMWIGGSLGGVRGIAIVVLLIPALSFYPAYRFLVYATCGVRLREYLTTLLRPLAASIAAISLGYAAALLLPDTIWTQVIAGSGITIVTYGIVSFAVNRSWLLAMRELLSLGNSPS